MTSSNSENHSENHFENQGIIAWFVCNPVAANLLKIFIVVLGLFALTNINKKSFPEFEANSIQVRVAYPGSAPQEVEEGVTIKIEEAIEGIEGIKEVRSTSSEGISNVTATIERNYDIDALLNEIKINTDAITTFPELAEKPIISKGFRGRPSIAVAIHGEANEKTRKAYSEKIKNELLELPDVNKVEISGARNFEVTIEVPELTLRQYDLTLDSVARAIRAQSLDLPGGSIKSRDGDILLRTKGQAYTALDFEKIVLRSNPDGTRLMLGDIANVIDGFEESESFARFNKNPSINIQIYVTEDANILAMTESIKNYIDKKSGQLPPGIKLDFWADTSKPLADRIQLMLENMLTGAILVLVVLALFLRLTIAFWVVIGIPVAFLGSVLLLYVGPFPVTINLLSLFGYILVLGIVVDDAIIIGESIYSEIEKKGHSVQSVIDGAKRVAIPATFGVLTTIAAFLPLMFTTSGGAPFLIAISAVVIWCLFFSLVESKLILPAHLARSNLGKVSSPSLLSRAQDRVSNGLNNFVENYYQPLLEKALRNKRITVTLFFSLFVITLGGLISGHVKFVFFPNIPNDTIRATLAMEQGTPTTERDRVLSLLENSIYQLEERDLKNNPSGERYLKNVSTYTSGDTGGNVIVELVSAEERTVSAYSIEESWRKAIGPLPGVKELRITAKINPGGPASLSFQLSSNDLAALEKAAEKTRVQLANYEGVIDINDTLNKGSKEIQLNIKPEAEALGISLADLGQQVRQSFFGAEAQRIQRGNDDIRVMVRYPLAERQSIANLENMKIRTPNGGEVPFSTVATVKEQESYASIYREQRTRAVVINANINFDVAQPGLIISDMYRQFIPQLRQELPSVQVSLVGASKERDRSQSEMAAAGLIALFLIYALLAIPLKSYMQPLLIMSVIPFGIIGAVFGHVLLGMTVSMFSFFGILALSGVVVNDSLIMVDFVNKAREEGMSAFDAIMQSGKKRFRAILLTSLTTSLSLLPIIAEKSLQAQFIKPMAVSISFGIIFATIITLFLVPVLYLAGRELSSNFRERMNMKAARNRVVKAH